MQDAPQNLSGNRCGVQSNDQPRTLTFLVEGMDCPDEVNALRRELTPLVGDEDALHFDLLGRQMTIVLRDRWVSSSTIVSAVARTGMRAIPLPPAGPRAGQGLLGTASVRPVVASGILLLAGAILHAWWGSDWKILFADHDIPLVPRLIYGLAIVVGGWRIAPRAWLALRRLRPDMHLLMTVAVVGALALGDWFEAATVTFLFALALALESWSVGRARGAVAALIERGAPYVRVLLPEGREELLPPEQVPVGTRFRVRPGETIPLDGRVVAGSSDVNQAPITGESLPVTKQPGDEVYAGTINGAGLLVVESTKPASDTVLARLIRLVEEARRKRAPSEQWVDRFARVYTPATIALAVAVAVVPPLLLGYRWSDWFYRSLVLLVIGCPCALVISTPVSIVAALTAAARHGVLIKAGLFVEEPARLRAMAFDKTGTLTLGKPVVVRVVPTPGYTATQVLEIAAGLEAHSGHPLGQAILDYARQQAVHPPLVEEFNVLPGRGATGQLRGKWYWIGSHRYLHEQHLETPAIHLEIERASASGHTTVIVGSSEGVCGLIVLADRIRPEAPAAIAALREAGVQHLVMLTGDGEPTAQAVARQLGLDAVYAELLPEDKLRLVEQLTSRYGRCAMVGDGINDAPAMSRATLGIAMGAIGSDAAIEAADIALMTDDLTRLPWLVHHSRRTLRIIRQNVSAAIGIKLLFVGLTFAGAASLWAAIAADMGVSVGVTLNALRLLRSGRSTALASQPVPSPACPGCVDETRQSL